MKRTDFYKRVLKELAIDTRKYRYIADRYPDRAEIKRIEKTKLDTVAALNEWETVYIFK